MNSIPIDLPVLVQNIAVEGVKQYYLKPLFLSYPIVTHRRYERAVAKFQSELRHMFKGFQVSRANMDELLWYRFNPKVEYKAYPMTFTVNKSFVKGSFGIAHFMLQDLCFVCLPAFNNYIFIAEKNEYDRYDIPTQAEKVIKSFFKEEVQDEGFFEPEAYFSDKNEFVSYVQVQLSVTAAPFPFEADPYAAFFSNFGGQDNFVGEIEIEKVGYDLNERFPADLKRAYYREELVAKVSSILYQNENSPIVIVGAEGVGKRSVLHEAVYQYLEIHNDKTKNTNELEKIWHIDPTRIIAGMSIVGMWQKRLEAILNFVLNRRKNFAFKKGATDKIVIDNVVSMLRIGKSSQNDMTLSDVIKPYLEKRTIQVILIATPSEWKKMQEKDRRFADLFQVISVEEPDLKTAARMVFKQRILLELEHGCQIGGPAIAQLFSIHRNYLQRQALPGSVMKILRQLAVKYKFQPIDVDEIRREFEELSGLYKEIFDDNYTFDRNEVEERISTQLVGQPAAAQSLADVVHLIKSKLTSPSKPLASFMFIGPTGVGKTQAAKVLCAYLMGNEDHLMRFDMNEFIDDYAVERLIGDYANPEGQLTGKVRYKPFGILLLDEIEKAHPKVHDLLLQVLDDGRLTDSLGRTVDFSNTIIIMTSNIGAKEADSVVGFKTETTDESAIYRKAMENHFRPEFINRIDKVVIFKNLEKEHIFAIARLQINELLRRDGFVRRTTMLNIKSDALQWVAERGYNAKMGGRALKRQIEKDLTVLSAEQLISTNSDRPIIFEILLKDNQLYPNIIPLDFVASYEEEWLPTLPTEKQGRKFYGQLLRVLDNIKRQVEHFEKAQNFSSYEDEAKVYVFNGEETAQSEYVDDKNWMFYDFKNKLAELKEQIQEISLGYQNKFFISKPVIPLRMKRVAMSINRRDGDWGGLHRRSMKDRIFQEEGMTELMNTYRFNAIEFDRTDSQFLDHWLDVSFLQLFLKGVLRQQADEITIHFSSYIAGLGEKEIDFLVERYVEMFNGLDISYHLNEDKNCFTLEGFSFYELLKGEDGVHLFYTAHQNPLPIRVEVVLENSTIKETDKLLKVIRLYNGTSIITDLRTNFTNAGNISSSEFKLLLYGGLSSEVREELGG